MYLFDFLTQKKKILKQFFLSDSCLIYQGRTEAAVRHDDVLVAAALLPALLAPVLDADRLIGFHHVCDLHIWVDLREQRMFRVLEGRNK